jgi:hypothetical protein
MRFALKTWLFGALSLGLAAPALAEEAVQDQIKALQDRMQQMEQKLDATSDQLEAANQKVEAQREIIERAGIESDPSQSGLAGFLDTLKIGGWVSASYWYNFNDPDNDVLVGANSGVGGLCCSPFNPDANQFSFDQLWFELEKPISSESRAGFRADIVFGRAAGLLPGGNTPNVGRRGGNNLYLNQAYVQYLIPYGEVTLTAGKFATLIGAEVAQDHPDYNWNVSRGIVYQLLQPIEHTGVLLSGNLPGGLDWAAGVANNVLASQPVINDGKAAMGHLRWTGEMASVALNGIWGTDSGFGPGAGVVAAVHPTLGPIAVPCGADISEVGFFGVTEFPFSVGCTRGGNEDVKRGIIDLIATFTATDKLSFLLNADYAWREGVSGPGVTDPSRSDPKAYGIAFSTRYQWTDRLRTALRMEWAQDDTDFFGYGAANIVRAAAYNAAFGTPLPSAIRGTSFCPNVSALGGCPGLSEDSSLYAITFTTDFAIANNLMLRGEVRYDHADIDQFSDNFFVSDGDQLIFGDDDQWLAGAQIIYTF